MKTKLVILFAAIMVMGLSIAAVAYSTSTKVSKASTSCCSGDSCPLKGKKASADKKESCCDDCDCCTGDSCPMKAKGKSHAHAEKMADGEACPMKMKAEKADTATIETASAVTKTKGNCCGCSCCGGEKKTETTASL